MFHKTFVDDDGRKFVVAVPNEDDPAEYGIIIGPPFLDSLGLPYETMIALHNELHRRKLLTKNDVRLRPNDVVAALQSALRVSANQVMELYDG